MKLASHHFDDQLLGIDFGQSPCSDIAAVLQNGHPVADAIDFFHSVGNVYHRDAPLAQAANNLKQRMDLLAHSAWLSGSSSTITLAFFDRAFAIITICFCAMESDSISTVGLDFKPDLA